MDYKKTIAGVSAALVGLFAQVPLDIQKQSQIALGLIVLDVVLGGIAQAGNGRFSSSEMRKGLTLKFACFAGIIVFCSLVSFQSSTWNWVFAGWCAICASESASVLENLMLILRQAEKLGMKIGPVSSLLDKLEPLFAMSPKTPGSALNAPEDAQKGQETP